MPLKPLSRTCNRKKNWNRSKRLSFIPFVRSQATRRIFYLDAGFLSHGHHSRWPGSPQEPCTSYFFEMFLFSISSAQASWSSDPQEVKQDGFFHQTFPWERLEAGGLRKLTLWVRADSLLDSPLGQEPARVKVPGSGLFQNFQLHGVNVFHHRLYV